MNRFFLAGAAMACAAAPAVHAETLHGGFGTGCAGWAPESQCIPGGEGDHMFTLRGKRRLARP